MKTSIGSYDSGQITLESDDRSTTIQIRWPFDRSLDEWVSLSLRLSNEEIRKAIESGSSTIGAGDYLKLPDSQGGSTVLLSAQGTNALGPVYLDCEIGNADAKAVRRHLASA